MIMNRLKTPPNLFGHVTVKPTLPLGTKIARTGSPYERVMNEGKSKGQVTSHYLI